MLKGECNDILDSFDRDGQGVSRETFAYDDLDAAQLVGRAPVVLAKQFATERRKLELFQLAILREFWYFFS